MPEPRPDTRDLRELRERYARRPDARVDQRYSMLMPAARQAVQQREGLVLSEFRREGVRDLGDLDILDVGCGRGRELLRWIGLGADPGRVHGVDVLEDRLAHARTLHSALDFRLADARELPFTDQSMDVVVQWTTFSSILDRDHRKEAAKEMARVLRPGGFLVWYDFRINPVNPDTAPIGRHEIRELFPGFTGRIRGLTLAPPIARRLAPRSAALAAVLQNVPFLQTHLLAILRKPVDTQPASG